MPRRLPPPRRPAGKKSCSHARTRRSGPYTVSMPKGPHEYYMIHCADCGKYLRNEDA